jgi:hypothetical protein
VLMLCALPTEVPPNFKTFIISVIQLCVNKNAFLFLGGRRFVVFVSVYTKRLSSSKVYPGGNNNCCYGVVCYHFLITTN